jgi:hypothetical protein
MSKEVVDGPAMSARERLLIDVYAQSEPAALDSDEARDRRRALERWLRMRDTGRRRRHWACSAAFASAAAILLCVGSTSSPWSRRAGTSEVRARPNTAEATPVIARKRQESSELKLTPLIASTIADLQARGLPQTTARAPAPQPSSAERKVATALVVPQPATAAIDLATEPPDPASNAAADESRPQVDDPLASHPPLLLESPITLAPASVEQLRELQDQPANDVAVVMPPLESDSVDACEREEPVGAALPAQESRLTRHDDARCRSSHR